MNSDTQPVQEPTITNREAIATRFGFLILGLAASTWAPLVPLVKARLSLTDAQLGFLILAIGIGSVLTMPFAGSLAHRYGCRKVLIASCLVLLTSVPLIPLAPSYLVLGVVLLVYGGVLGSLDVVINLQGVQVENALARPLMSGFHGFYSLGGIVGAGAATILLSAGASAFGATLATLVAGLAILIYAIPGFLTNAGEGDRLVFQIPRGVVLVIGILAGTVFCAEGSVTDWSALLLTREYRLTSGLAGFGYVAFASCMTLGRLTGDKIVARLGPLKILLAGGAICVLGFWIAAASSVPFLGFLGFALVGLGASNVVPVLFSACGRQRVIPPHVALSIVTIMGYAGFLIGPAAIGEASHHLGIRVAMALIGVAVLLVPFFASWIIRQTLGDDMVSS